MKTIITLVVFLSIGAVAQSGCGAACCMCHPSCIDGHSCQFSCMPVCIGECGNVGCQVSDDRQVCNVYGSSCLGTLTCTDKAPRAGGSTAEKPILCPNPKHKRDDFHVIPGTDSETIRRDIDELLRKRDLALKQNGNSCIGTLCADKAPRAGGDTVEENQSSAQIPNHETEVFHVIPGTDSETIRRDIDELLRRRDLALKQ